MSGYTLGHHESVLRSHRWRTVGNSAAYLLPHLSPGLRILDVGCGPGTITVDFARIVGERGQVLGVDSSAEVIRFARDDAPVDGNVRFEVADVMDLDVPDASFDVAHAHQVLQHLQDPVAALRQLRRVTRPGGLVAARDADYGAMTWHPASAELDTWLSTYRAIARRDGAEPDAGRRLLSWAQRAGFRDVTPSASVWCFATPTDREWWGGLMADRVTESAVAERMVAASLVDEAALRRMAAAWRAWATTHDAWFTVVHGEVLCRVDV